MKIYVKIPSLLSRILGRSTTSTRPMHIYMGAIWALVFYYYISNNLPREKTAMQMLQYKLSFSKYVL